jgi:3-dehydroquinate dehydratase II
MARILLLNGPNLNLLGSREPAIYGSATLRDIEEKLSALTRAKGHELLPFQSNAEHELIARIHTAKRDGVAFVIINAGAFTHTSIALRDALLAVSVPFIEVHLSNIFAREQFRHRSYLSGIAAGCIVGLGAIGYELALEAACARLAVT